MKFSIITVCFNSAATVRDTLDSVNAQDHPDLEHVVIDGGSRDGTVDLVQAHKRRPGAVVSERDRGIYDAMNKGLARATGEVIGLLNADDVLAHPGVISRLAREFADPAVDACYGDLDYYRPDWSRAVRYWRSRPHAPGLMLRGWMPAHPTFYLRSELYRRHGGYDDRLRIAADFELCLRMLEVHRIRARYLPEVLVHMRTGGASNAGLRSIWRSNREASEALRRHGYPGGPWVIARKLASKLPQLLPRPASRRADRL